MVLYLVFFCEKCSVYQFLAFHIYKGNMLRFCENFFPFKAAIHSQIEVMPVWHFLLTSLVESAGLPSCSISGRVIKARCGVSRFSVSIKKRKRGSIRKFAGGVLCSWHPEMSGSLIRGCSMLPNVTQLIKRIKWGYSFHIQLSISSDC